MGVFSGRTARELGFVKYLAADPTALAKALGLPPKPSKTILRWEVRGAPSACRSKGAITPILAQQTVRLIENLLRDDGVNFLCVWIESPGGSLVDSVTLANALADLDPGQVRTVAYVANEAAGDAALVAMACDQVVVQRDATLGGSGSEDFCAGRTRRGPSDRPRAFGPAKLRSWSLVAALVDPRLPVFRYTHSGTGSVEYFCPEEAESQADADQWVKGEEIHKPSRPAAAVGASGGRAGIGPACSGRLR